MPSWISQRITSGPSITICATSSGSPQKCPARRVSSKCSCGTVVRAHGGLDAAFGHDGVAVAQAQLGREDHPRALPRPR